MNEPTKYKFYRRVLFSTGIVMLAQMFWPTAALALTSGPSQPEFTSFEPVATTNMVNEFSGDFMYNLPILNIPGANGGGYPLSLSYHSGTSGEEEASWVGYGWSLNPGAINRGKRGFPDDMKGGSVNYWNKVPTNWTTSVGGAIGVEGFSYGIGLSANVMLRYNNYKGFGYSAGTGISFGKGTISLGYGVSDGTGSFSARVNPAKLLSYASFEEKKSENQSAVKAGKTGFMDKLKSSYMANNGKRIKENLKGVGSMSLIGSNYGLFSVSDVVRSATMTAYVGNSYNLTIGIQPNLTGLQIGPNYNLFGNYTYQDNVPLNSLSAYGFMYSKAATGSTNMMDYYTEKFNPYDKQDKYLGMPISNTDNFMVTGEGLGGGFRLYNKSAGHFRPNRVSSHTDIYNVGGEIDLGMNNGGGFNLGIGSQDLTLGEWNSSLSSFNDSTSSDEPYYFRFNNDLGGSVETGNGDNAQSATVVSTGGNPGSKSFDPSISGITTLSNNASRSGRSSYISYHTNSEMMRVVSSKYYNRYQKYLPVDTKANSGVTRSTAKIKDGIGEFTTFNEDGNRYVYGLPVYSKNELNMQYDLQGVSASNIDSNFAAIRDISSDFNLKSKVGEDRPDPYATSYLLTEITSPDYVDRTMDGPTDDDFGGFTRFSYARMFGTNDKTSSASAWYKWRMPYNGLLYNRGELSSQLDDMGSVAYGEKEIYYLDTISTKTHYAVFYKSNRYDSYGAKDNNTAANSFTAADTIAKVQKLDSIKVFAKNGGTPQIIKTVRFEYDYSLCKNQPNAAKGTYGKLTLKRVWFEYEGVFNAKIAPYVFDYNYSTVTYPSVYSALNSYGAGTVQNPSYNKRCLDPWGNYQEKGGRRFDSLMTWTSQRPTATFDPAAWQLKRIVLPTGGEIHVQYEQDQYAYVQDKLAMAMVSLKSSTTSAEIASGLPIVGKKYFINHADFGIAYNSTEYKALLKKIRDMFVVQKKKISFKFLYNLIGFTAPTKSTCTAEYITGYCDVKYVNTDATAQAIYLVLEGSVTLPRNVALNYLKTQRLGSLALSGNCDPSVSGVTRLPGSSPAAIAEQLVGFLATTIVPTDAELCQFIEPSLSFFRVPVPVAKRGGGLRVKRLLMYDKGVESGDAALYGNEYQYTNIDGSSSGVATNEPSSVRFENALVDFDPKFKQSFINKIVAGRDREQNETPLGESIMPSASVGYSRVVVKNIYSGKTNPGFAVKEFYTAKDYPVTTDYSSIHQQKDFFPLPGGFINYFVNNVWMSQGYSIRLNAMHGQPKSDATYNGDPSDFANAALSSKQEYNYFQPGEQVPMMASLGNITYANPGKEMELVFESRKVTDVSNDIAAEFDLDLGIFGFIPVPFYSMFPSYTYNESKLSTHVTTKIINYPAIVKSTSTTVDGITHTTENIGFNPHNGKPILTRTYDGYNDLKLQQASKQNGTYLAYTIPASQQYKTMGQKATSERAIFVSDPLKIKIEFQVTGGKYYLNFTPSRSEYYCTYTGKYCPGDLIRVTKKSDGSEAGIYNVTDSLVGGALFISKAINFYTGTPSTNYEVVVEVLRSGCTNQLSTTTGSFTTYGVSTNSFGTTDTIAGISALEYQKRVRLAFVLDSVLQATSIGSKVSLYVSLLPLSGINYVTGGGCEVDYWPAGISYLSIVPTTDSVGFFCSHLPYPIIPYTGSYFRYSQKYNKGHIGLDPVTAQLVWYTGPYVGDSPGGICNLAPFDCFNFCASTDGTKSRIANVVQANSQSFTDNWNYDNTLYPVVTNSNKYENGMKGKWRKQNDYVYNDTIIGANTGTQRNYKNAGVFKMNVFNWKTPTSNDPNKWIKTDSVTQYSPDGNALEEQDIFGIYSAAKYGYDKNVPYLVAKNSDYNSVFFDGFEKSYNSNGNLEDAWNPGSIGTYRIAAPSTFAAHSGKYCWYIPGSSSPNLPLKSFKLTQQMKDNGLLVKAWVRDTSSVAGASITGGLTGVSPSTFTFTKIARTGDWTLYEGNILKGNAAANGTAVTININTTRTTGSGGTIWVDDVRYEPANAQMTTYVYDIGKLRLITSFDDQHFGLYYQYDAEGKLIRKQVETTKGLKTITETQYHTPLVPR